MSGRWLGVDLRAISGKLCTMKEIGHCFQNVLIVQGLIVNILWMDRSGEGGGKGIYVASLLSRCQWTLMIQSDSRLSSELCGIEFGFFKTTFAYA